MYKRLAADTSCSNWATCSERLTFCCCNLYIITFQVSNFKTSITFTILIFTNLNFFLILKFWTYIQIVNFNLNDKNIIIKNEKCTSEIWYWGKIINN